MLNRFAVKFRPDVALGHSDLSPNGSSHVRSRRALAQFDALNVSTADTGTVGQLIPGKMLCFSGFD